MPEGPILAEDVERYLYQLLPERDDVLRRMEVVALKRRIPIVGPAVGRLLLQLARMIGAKRIFEMGSAIGYSTIWLAHSIPPGQGLVYYTDGSRKHADEAQGNFQRAGVADRVRIMVGNSLELIDEVEGDFDLIFNDVDKHFYPQVFLKAASRLRRGGALVTDNVLWSGRVARDDDDDSTLAIREYNRLIYAAPDLYTTIVPLRDGVAVSYKL
ncbi:MAG: O-methyltransferase [Acidobacteria bacterium]|nr:O-methyltransferase [Acidobacteriota bacterium]